MINYPANTIWKRQLRTLLTVAVSLAGLALVLALYSTTVNLLLGRNVGHRGSFIATCEIVGALILMTQVLISGLLLGAEEEENQTHSFILRLPVKRQMWVQERLFAAFIAFIVCLVLLVIEGFVFGSYLKISNLEEGLIAALSDIFSFSGVVSGFMYFWICAFFGSVIKKVLPAAGAALGTVFLILLLLSNIADHSEPYAMRHTANCFLLMGFVFLALYAFALSRREGT